MGKPGYKILYFTLLFAWLLGSCTSNQGNATPTIVEASPTLAPTRLPSPTVTPTPIVVSGTISIWHSWQDGQVPALLRTIAAFQEEYPSVLFDVLYVPELDLKAKYEQAALDGWAPGILIGSSEWAPSLYKTGWIADLNGLAGTELLERLNPAGVEASRVGTALAGLPVDLHGVVLYRNRSIVPQLPATFEELVEIAKAATRADRFGAILERSFFFSAGHLFGLGGRLMLPDGSPAFNDPTGQAWLNLLRSFEQAGPTESFGDNDLTLFSEGRAGMIIDGTWNRKRLAEAIGPENLAIDPWPVHADGTLAGYVQAEDIYLHSTRIDEPFQISWKFIQYLLAADGQAAVAQAGMIPAIDGSPTSLAVSQVQVDDPLIAQAMAALAVGYPYLPSPEMDIYRSQLDVAMDSVFANQASPAAALQAAQEAILQALAQLRATPTPIP